MNILYQFCILLFAIPSYGQTKTINYELDNLNKLQKIKIIKAGTNCSIYEKDSISMTICKQAFIKSKHNIQYNEKAVVKIDHKQPYGIDGELPKTEIKSISLKIGAAKVAIPKSAYFDLFEPSLNPREQVGLGDLSVYCSKDGNRLYIMMQNSDGAGFYIATLIIVKKKYYSRRIENDF
jgi:hypothetical protein